MITQDALHGGKQCPHRDGAIKHETCNEDIPCPIDCEGYWSEWDQCTEDCGPDGSQTRHYIVTVEAEHGGMQCSHLDKVQIRSCDPEPVPCPIPAVCAFTQYSQCSANCHDTLNPVPVVKHRAWVQLSKAQHGGEECIEAVPEAPALEAMCHVPNCPIACEGHWSEYDTCNARIAGGCAGEHFCGRGTRTKTYHVDVVAKFGGEECPFLDGAQTSKLCGDTDCPVDCVGEFSEWESCSAPCGGGSQARKFGVNVTAHAGGCECDHADGHLEHQECNTHPCPIDCEGSWGVWEDCTQECTDCRATPVVHGSSKRTFAVTVEAQHGGATCTQLFSAEQGDVEERECNSHCCPENCEGSWSEFGDCSATCGGGNAMRKYTITHAAAYGGVECPYCADATHTAACNNTKPCPIDCEGEWEGWSSCDAQCNGGYQYNYFIQTELAQYGGKECEHEDFEEDFKECNTGPCPRRCLGRFGSWGKCDADCSGGKKQRTFSVVRAAVGGGPECDHEDGFVEEEACNTHDCPEGYECPPVQTCQYSSGLIKVR